MFTLPFKPNRCLIVEKLVSTFNKEKAIVGAFSRHCETSRRSDDSCTAVLQLPGADGDEGLVRDVAEDEQQHLVRTPPDVALIVTRRHLSESE